MSRCLYANNKLYRGESRIPTTTIQSGSISIDAVPQNKLPWMVEVYRVISFSFQPRFINLLCLQTFEEFNSSIDKAYQSQDPEMIWGDLLIEEQLDLIDKQIKMLVLTGRQDYSLELDSFKSEVLASQKSINGVYIDLYLKNDAYEVKQLDEFMKNWQEETTKLISETPPFVDNQEKRIYGIKLCKVFTKLLSENKASFKIKNYPSIIQLFSKFLDYFDCLTTIDEDQMEWFNKILKIIIDNRESLMQIASLNPSFYRFILLTLNDNDNKNDRRNLLGYEVINRCYQIEELLPNMKKCHFENIILRKLFLKAGKEVSNYDTTVESKEEINTFIALMHTIESNDHIKDNNRAEVIQIFREFESIYLQNSQLKKPLEIFKKGFVLTQENIKEFSIISDQYNRDALEGLKSSDNMEDIELPCIDLSKIDKNNSKIFGKKNEIYFEIQWISEPSIQLDQDIVYNITEYRSLNIEDQNKIEIIILSNLLKGNQLIKDLSTDFVTYCKNIIHSNKFRFGEITFNRHKNGSKDISHSNYFSFLSLLTKL